MRLLITLLVLIGGVSQMRGQGGFYPDILPPSLYQYNYTTFNSAFAGLEGSRITGMGSYFNSDEYSRSTAIIASEFRLSKMNSGIGFIASRNHAQYDNTTYLQGMYNYQFKFANEGVFSVAVDAAYREYSFNHTRMVIRSVVPMYDYDYTGMYSGWTSGAALAYTSKKLFTGVSIGNVFYTDMKDKEGPTFSGGPLVIQTIFGYKFHLGKKIVLTSSINTLGGRGVILTDLNSSFLFFDSLIAGISLLSRDGISPAMNAGIKMGDVGKIVVSVFNQENKDRNDDKKFSGELMLQFNVN